MKTDKSKTEYAPSPKEKHATDFLKKDRRERIATACLQGLLARTTYDSSTRAMTLKAIEFADALIAELEK